MNVNKVILLFIVISAAYCEGQNSHFNVALSNLSKSYGNTATTQQILQVIGVKELLIEKCIRTGMWASSIERVFNSEEVKRCENDKFDMNMLFDSSNNGPTRNTMRKVCAKSSYYKECSDTEATILRPCLSPEERADLDSYLDGERRLIDYLCFNDGERVIRFTEGGGPYCFQEQWRPIGECSRHPLNKIYQILADVHKNNEVSDNIFQGPLLAKVCNELWGLLSCVVSPLRHCRQPDHADFVDTFASMVLKASPCRNHMPSSLGAGAIVAIVIGVVLLVATAVGVYRWRRRRAGAAGRRDAKGGAAGGGPGAVGLL